MTDCSGYSESVRWTMAFILNTHQIVSILSLLFPAKPKSFGKKKSYANLTKKSGSSVCLNLCIMSQSTAILSCEVMINSSHTVAYE